MLSSTFLILQSALKISMSTKLHNDWYLWIWDLATFGQFRLEPFQQQPAHINKKHALQPLISHRMFLQAKLTAAKYEHCMMYFLTETPKG